MLKAKAMPLPSWLLVDRVVGGGPLQLHQGRWSLPPKLLGIGGMLLLPLQEPEPQLQAATLAAVAL